MIFLNFIESSRGQWKTYRTTFKVNSNNILIDKLRIKLNHNKASEKNDSYFLSTKEKSKFFKEKNLNIIASNHLNLNHEMTSVQINRNKHSNLFSVYTNRNNHILSINTHGQLTSHERIWFINPNLRLSTTIIKKNNYCIAVSFTSEIKMSVL